MSQAYSGPVQGDTKTWRNSITYGQELQQQRSNSPPTQRDGKQLRYLKGRRP